MRFSFTLLGFELFAVEVGRVVFTDEQIEVSGVEDVEVPYGFSQ